MVSCVRGHPGQQVVQPPEAGPSWLGAERWLERSRGARCCRGHWGARAEQTEMETGGCRLFVGGVPPSPGQRQREAHLAEPVFSCLPHKTFL